MADSDSKNSQHQWSKSNDGGSPRQYNLTFQASSNQTKNILFTSEATQEGSKEKREVRLAKPSPSKKRKKNVSSDRLEFASSHVSNDDEDVNAKRPKNDNSDQQIP